MTVHGVLSFFSIEQLNMFFDISQHSAADIAEIANDKISFLVNACMYHLRLEEMEKKSA